MRLQSALVIGALMLAACAVAHAQPALSERPRVEGATDATALLADTAVRAALDAARADEPRTIEDQIRLCEIPAPPFKEAERARVFADAFRTEGLRNVRIDRVGNVIETVVAV